jgi:hypothetical protein
MNDYFKKLLTALQGFGRAGYEADREYLRAAQKVGGQVVLPNEGAKYRFESRFGRGAVTLDSLNNWKGVRVPLIWTTPAVMYLAQRALEQIDALREERDRAVAAEEKHAAQLDALIAVVRVVADNNPMGIISPNQKRLLQALDDLKKSDEE